MNAEEARRLAALEELAQVANVTDIDLAEDVHDVLSRQEAEINRSGVRAQLMFLIDALGEREVRAIIENYG